MQKFIVTADGVFKYGDVNMHKDLLAPHEECIGGGMYEWDHVNHRLSLSGKSYDFGRVKWSWIDTLRVPSSLRGYDIVYEDMPLVDFVDVEYFDKNS